MKTDFFQSCGHCCVFQICWHIECSTFTTSSFTIWNSSTGISSPLLALFVVMLPKAHLTSHPRMSGSRWVITPHDYLGCEDLFCMVLLCIVATSSYYLLLLLGSYHKVLSLIEPIFAWNVSLVSLIFLKRSRLSHSIVFLYCFALIADEGFLIAPCYSLELCIQMGISFFFSFAFCFSSCLSYL